MGIWKAFQTKKKKKMIYQKSLNASKAIIKGKLIALLEKISP